MPSSQLLPLIALSSGPISPFPRIAGSSAGIKALGIPSVMMHDYEHSTKTGFLEPEWTLMPDIIPDAAMGNQRITTLEIPGAQRGCIYSSIQG